MIVRQHLRNVTMPTPLDVGRLGFFRMFPQLFKKYGNLKSGLSQHVDF